MVRFVCSSVVLFTHVMITFFFLINNVPHLSDNLSQSRVTHDKPATRCDTIGLVLKLLWVHFIEVLKTVHRINPTKLDTTVF